MHIESIEFLQIPGTDKDCITTMSLNPSPAKGATIQYPGGRGGGGAGGFFQINNFGRTSREINNLLQELFYINNKSWNFQRAAEPGWNK